MLNRAFQAGWTSATSGTTSFSSFATRLFCSVSPASAPFLSDVRSVTLVIAAYLVLLSAVRAQSFALRDAPLVKYVAIAHNLFLAVASAFMNIHATQAILSVSRSQSWHATVCTPAQTAVPSPIQSTIYIFYLSKYYELLDTFILVLRNKPLSVLHVWHHSTVILSVWGWLEYGVTVGIHGLWFNTFVHVFMYTYFAFSLAGVKTPFKRLITLTQIIQFLTGFASLIPFFWSYIKFGGCTGLPGLAVTGVINLSYLILFLRFYSKSYKSNTNTVKSLKAQKTQ